MRLEDDKGGAIIMAHPGRRLRALGSVIDSSQLPSPSPTSFYHLNHSDSALSTRTKTQKGGVSHMDKLFIDEKNVSYLLHASSKAGKVILDTIPLDRYLAQNRLTGICVIRLKE